MSPCASVPPTYLPERASFMIGSTSHSGWDSSTTSEPTPNVPSHSPKALIGHPLDVVRGDVGGGLVAHAEVDRTPVPKLICDSPECMPQGVERSPGPVGCRGPHQLPELRAHPVHQHGPVAWGKRGKSGYGFLGLTRTRLGRSLPLRSVSTVSLLLPLGGRWAVGRGQFPCGTPR